MYLFGRMYPQGRWFYFPAAFLIKSTIGFLLLLLLIPFSKALWRSDVRREVLFLAIPPVIFFGAALTSKLDIGRSEEHTSELQSLRHLVCRLLLEKKKG